VRALLYLALGSCVGWTARDYATQSTIAALQAVDAYQTESITSAGRESNPLLGAHGQRVPSFVYFPVVALSNVLVSDVLPHGWWRSSWQDCSVAVQAWTVWHNEEAGF
jgi:hypothetical protein